MVKNYFDPSTDPQGVRINGEAQRQLKRSVQKREQLKKICEIGRQIIGDALEKMTDAECGSVAKELHILQDLFESAYSFECLMKMIRQGQLHLEYDKGEDCNE